MSLYIFRSGWAPIVWDVWPLELEINCNSILVMNSVWQNGSVPRGPWWRVPSHLSGKEPTAAFKMASRKQQASHLLRKSCVATKSRPLRNARASVYMCWEKMDIPTFSNTIIIIKLIIHSCMQKWGHPWAVCIILHKMSVSQGCPNFCIQLKKGHVQCHRTHSYTEPLQSFAQCYTVSGVKENGSECSVW